MATMQTFDQGKLIGPDEWNAHANQINTNTDGLAAGATRITTLETNQGTRGTNGTLYSEIDTLKTNQGTRGTNGAIYTEIGTLKTTVARRDIAYKATLASTTNLGANGTFTQATISIPNPGWTYQLWVSGVTSAQWSASNGWGKCALQTSTTWGTGVISVQPFFAQAANLKITGTIPYTTDSVNRTGAATVYFLIHNENPGGSPSMPEVGNGECTVVVRPV